MQSEPRNANRIANLAHALDAAGAAASLLGITCAAPVGPEVEQEPAAKCGVNH